MSNIEFHTIKAIVDHLYQAQIITGMEYYESIKKLLDSYDLNQAIKMG